MLVYNIHTTMLKSELLHRIYDMRGNDVVL